MSSSGNSTAKEIKVTVIETQFVQTDQANFKAVVQQLTGRDQVPVAAVRVVPQRPRVRRRPPFGYAGEEGGAQGWCGERPAVEVKEPFLEDLYALCASQIFKCA